MRIGYFLSSEECAPATLVEQARLAEEAGFEALWISDRYHPWNDEQGQSPFVWGSSARSRRSAACPSRPPLNEHVLGDRWPTEDVRLEMLEEAVEVMRALWEGEFVSHHGRHYTVENARIYTRPDEPPSVYVSAFGPKSFDTALRIGDGFITTQPDAERVEEWKAKAGHDKPTQVGYKVCVAETEDGGVATAHRLWRNSGLPGELSQVLPSPRHFEQASELVTPEMTRGSTTCGRDVDRHVDAFRPYAEAGFDEVYVSNKGAEPPHVLRPLPRRGAPSPPFLRVTPGGRASPTRGPRPRPDRP